MSSNANDIQSDFLSAVIRERKIVWVFLVNGIKLTGQLMSFDKYALALQSPTGIQTVFKSAVSTVCESHFVENGGAKGRPATTARASARRGDQR
ncbi:Hfq protein [Caballeronia arvi]|uniref:Hfq protein n=2 Tax=Caballeronia arvi TaxID=1777135 RepID=A0A158L2N0_9BURK|nr:Hfq protein [Caballeronia arvi]